MNNQKKILIFHLHSNGDCLYATAIARQIKTDYPGCHLTWGVATFCKSILENNPFIDQVWEIPNVNKSNSTAVHRKLKKEILKKKKDGIYDEVFFTQLIDDNIANYDGCIRSGIFRGYNKPITVDITPVLRLFPHEKERVDKFAIQNKLKDYQNIILFEYAPQSAQLAITDDIALKIANEITQDGKTAIILSSAKPINSSSAAIIDGSELSLRETAALTFYCTHLLGCSSGISWLTTSDAAKMLTMVQVLDPYSPWVNPMSRDFERFGISTSKLIEIYDNNPDVIVGCMIEVLNNDFAEVKKKYYAPLPLHFIGTSRGIYNMLCFLQFHAIVKHIRINISVFGFNPKLILAILSGIFTAPFKLLKNTYTKRFLKA
jgi:hypothetical protein